MASKPAVKKERPPPAGDTGAPKLKVVAGTGGGGVEIASPLEAKWTIHAINVQQGDAILLDLQYGDTEPHKRYLIDGGTGNEKPLENLQACLKTQKCVSSSVNPVSKKKELEVEAVIVTHPDKDHVGGVTQLLKEYSYHGELVITEAFEVKLQRKEDKEKKKGKKAGPKPFLRVFFDAVKETFGDESPSILERECELYGSLHCHFPMIELRGLLYSPEATRPAKEEKTDGKCKTEGGEASATVAKGDASGDKMAAPPAARLKRMTDKFANKSSILTTVNENAQGFDVLLTGDSYANLIQPVISEKAKGKSQKPHIRVFQVPHHGSKMNSSYGSKVNSSYEFYSSFTADIYLVSGGGHDKYDHPHMEVLSSIIRACVKNQHTCRSKIVVTNSFGLNLSKLCFSAEERTVPWREFVTIYHFDDVFNCHNPSPAVTITSDRGLEESDVVIWSPQGYITKIRASEEKFQIRASEEKFQKQKVEIFKKDTKSCLISCSSELQFDTKLKTEFTILSVPVPEQPWAKAEDGKTRVINRIYVLKDSISSDFTSAWFLELDEESKDQVPKVYFAYRYTDDYFECKEYMCQTKRARMKLTLKPEVR